MGGALEGALSQLLGVRYQIFFVPIVAAIGGMIAVNRLSWNFARFFGLLLFWISVSSLSEMWDPSKWNGYLDFFDVFKDLFGRSPAVIFLVVIFLVSLYLTLRISYRKVISHIHSRLPTVESVKGVVKEFQGAEKPSKEGKVDKKLKAEYDAKRKEIEIELEQIRKERDREKKAEAKPAAQLSINTATKHIPIIKKEPKGLLSGLFGGSDDAPKTGIAELAKHDAPKKSSLDFATWEFPPTTILNHIEHKNTVSDSEIREKSLMIQETLLQFGISVEMAGHKAGPTVVQYRLDPNDGVRLSKIENLKKDLTLALKAKSIRIQAPIPGVGLVGIEVPNDKRDMVGIREVLEHANFKTHKSKLAYALGKDINGDFVVGDLTKMPHLLIAGQTGSGKSVGMNGIILSLLYKNSPSDLRMIMVDPKRVELGVYDGIPHLLTPVISESDKALNALKWAVAEMIRRYDNFKSARVRNIAEFNEKVEKKKREPVIVVIIDELADFMMSGNKKEIEAAICRIAQMGRAAGMHLVVATQRPSVDVITGLIKANIPSRIAFTVASLVDSRTVLDRQGAEDLLGMGDMLFSPVGSMAPERVQGVFVSTEEVESVVNRIKLTIDPEMLEDLYDPSIVEGDRGNFEGSVGGNGEGFEEDPKVIEEAIAFVRAQGKASTSMLQRHMRLGYSRAARVMDILERLGIIGPSDGSKPREVIG